MFKLEIDTSNAAFENTPAELHRLLLEVSERIQRGTTTGKIQDINGNTVGQFTLFRIS